MRSFNFEVVKQPLFTRKLEESSVSLIDNRQAIVNDVTGKVLSITSTNYNLFNNRKFEELTHHISESVGLELDHFASYKEGAKVIASFKNPNKDLKLLGVEFKDNLVLYDSRDKSTCMGLAGMGYYVRCANYFQSLRRTENQYKIYHNSNLDEMVAQFKLSLELYSIDQQKHIERLEKLEKIKITDSQACKLIGSFVNLSQREIQEVANGTHKGQISTRKQNIIHGLYSSWETESSDLGNNGFALWNTTTHYLTHKRRKGDSDFLFSSAGTMENKTIAFAEQFSL